jgi:peptidyl-prolyl cis-trans isomerase C
MNVRTLTAGLLSMVLISTALVQAEEKSAQPGTPATDAKTANVTLKDTDIVAKITLDGKSYQITFGELKKKLKTLPPQVQGAPLPQIYEPLLNSAIHMIVIEHNAKKLGLEKDEDVQQGIKDCQQAMVMKAYIDGNVHGLNKPNIKLDAVATEAELKRAYDEIIKILPKMEEARMHQAIFTKKEEAVKFIAELKKNADFAKVLADAQKTNADIKGGDLGYVKIPELPASIAEKVKKAAKATIIAEPIEEQLDGQKLYIAVKVDDKRVAPTPTFEEMKDEVKSITYPKFAQQVIERDMKAAKVEKTGLDGKPMTDAPKAEEKKAETPKVEEKKDDKAATEKK